MKEIKLDQYGRADYIDLVESMEVDVLVDKEIGRYQGDRLFLLKLNNRYGILIFGFGSCSGCDTLESCDTKEEVTKLRNELFDQIIWFPSKENVLFYLDNHDWMGDFLDEVPTEFIEECKKVLQNV